MPLERNRRVIIKINDLPIDEISEKDLFLAQIELERAIAARKEQKLLQVLQENKKYINKCYKTKSKYYKIVSELANNEYRVTALTFPVAPLYNLNIHFSINPYDYYNGIEGDFKSNFIKLEDIMINQLDYQMREISLEEYNLAMEKFL